MTIIGTLPDTTQTGQVPDNASVMANFNKVVSDVNANAAPLGIPAVFTSAESFGASTSATAAANAVAIQNALNGGGVVTLHTPGVFQIAYALLIKSNTKFSLGKNTTLQLATATNPADYGATTITSSGTTATVTTTSPLNLTIGSSHIMIVGGVAFAQDGYNGLWQATITGTNTFTYTLPNTISSPAIGISNQGGGATSGIQIGGPYMELGYVDNLVRNLNFFSPAVTVSAPAIDTTVGSGGSLSVGSVAVKFTTSVQLVCNVNDYLLFKGDTTRAFNGPHRVVKTYTNAVTIEFFSTIAGLPTPAGTLTAALCDVNIEIEGGIFDGNGVSSDGSWIAHVLNFNKTGYLNVHNVKVIRGLKYSVSTCNGWRPTFRDIYLETNSDGFHSMGPNWGVVVDGLSGSTNDDFLVHTSNDPENAYPFNVFPRNAGAVVNMPQGTITMGNTSQGTVPLGGGELVGFTARNIRPTFQNLRILLSGANNALPFNGMSGIVVDGLYSNFVNQSFGGGALNPQIVICAEPNGSQTSVVNDVTIRNWSIGNIRAGYFLVGFYDHNVAGPYTGSELVIDKLDFDNCNTVTPLQGINSTSRFFDNTYDSFSIGLLSIRNSKFDFDTTTAQYYFINFDNNNVNSEYINQILIDNCYFNHVLGVFPCAVMFLAGSAGSKLKNFNMSRCVVDAQVASKMDVIQMGNAMPSNNPIVTLTDNLFKTVQFVVGTTASIFTLNAKGNVLLASAYTDFFYLSGAIACYLAWSQNTLASGLHAVDPSGSTYIVLQGDSTLHLDLTKVSRLSAGASVVHNGASTAGTIPSGNIAVCDSTNAAGSWSSVKQTSGVPAFVSY